MSLTISPNPSSPPLHTKHTKPFSQNSIFTKPIFTISTKLNTKRVSASSFGVNPSLVFDNSANPFGKFDGFVPKLQCFLGSSFSHLCAQLTILSVEMNGQFEDKWVTMWEHMDIIGSLWPCSVREGYLVSTGTHAVQLVPAFLSPGPVNRNVRKSRLIVSAFNNPSPDRRLPKKEEQKMMHEGLITESLPNGMFRVQLDNKDMIIGYISGKMRKNFIRILPGDRVKVEVSRYDSTRGRIVLRLRNRPSSD